MQQFRLTPGISNGIIQTIDEQFGYIIQPKKEEDNAQSI